MVTSYSSYAFWNQDDRSIILDKMILNQPRFSSQIFGALSARCGLRTTYEFSTQYRTYIRHGVARKLFQDHVSPTTLLLVADSGSEVD
ncbi:hypothetical protein KCU95_g61, partial [Aureobasidium melanogenum]